MRVSTILPVYNGVDFISRAIDSFLEQDHEDKELIVVDGKSVDGTHDILKKYTELNNSIKWIQEEDRGLSHARNIGLKYASGDLIGFLGHDDRLHRGIFEQLNYYGTRFGFEMIYFGCLIYDENNGECFPGHRPFRKFTKKNLLKGFPIGAGECFYYKPVVFEGNLFDETLKCTMDYEFNLRIASSDKKYRFFGVDIPGVICYLHEGNLSTKESALQEKEAQRVRQKYKMNGGKLSLINYLKRSLNIY